MNAFDRRVVDAAGAPLHACAVEIIQVNLGLRCNQRCTHCHVEAGPHRTEVMDWPAMEWILKAAQAFRPGYVDLTGGAPELNPHFRRLVAALRADGHAVQVRTNLTALLEPGMQDLPEFLRGQQVQLAGSLPCYLEENVRAQRGEGVYARSVEALRRLSALGYGGDGPALNLVFNPSGVSLPPPQQTLESDYRRELEQRFGIRFNRLLTITNMPIGRFRDQLRRNSRQPQYEQMLAESFNPQTLDGLMCRHQISVGWDGRLYDCDFNLALGLWLGNGSAIHISQYGNCNLACRRIVTGEHCFGCTAGMGSSCAGAIA